MTCASLTASIIVVTDAGIKDPSLRQAILNELGESSDWHFLTKRDLLRIASLDVSQLGLSDLSGLEGASNLRQLDLSCQGCFFPPDTYGLMPRLNLKPLSKLEKLTDLDVSYNSILIDSSSGILQISALERLDISGAWIEDAGSLASLPNLHEVTIANPKNNELSGIGEVAELKVLRLEGYDSIPINDIAQLRELRVLSVNQEMGNMADKSGGVINEWPGPQETLLLEPITRMSKLEELHLVALAISDVSPLHILPKLRLLDVRYNPIEKGMDEKWLKEVHGRQ